MVCLRAPWEVLGIRASVSGALCLLGPRRGLVQAQSPTHPGPGRGAAQARVEGLRWGAAGARGCGGPRQDATAGRKVAHARTHTHTHTHTQNNTIKLGHKT